MKRYINRNRQGQLARLLVFERCVDSPFIEELVGRDYPHRGPSACWPRQPEVAVTNPNRKELKEVVHGDLKAFYSMWSKAGDPAVQKVFGEFFSFVVNLESKLVMEIV